MTLRNLIAKTSYKRAFNCIYKEYLQDYNKNKIELFSVNLQRSYDYLINLPKKECKNIIKLEMFSEAVCLHICDQDECEFLDFVEWEDLIDCEIVAPKKLSNSRILGEIIWEITFWGFTPKQIRANKKEITERSKNGEAFPLQEYKNRERRLI
jgi:hypothetical protein